jgi:hypothetical protein
MDDFTRAYIEAALFSSTDGQDDECFLDDFYGVDDLDADTLQTIITDCRKFQDENAADLAEAGADWPNIAAHAGHDFWFTRNGHGAGFWDGDWPEDMGERLTQAAESFGTYNLYVGDDGRIYGG